MTDEFMREEHYIVFKISDVLEHLTTTEAIHLARLYEIQRVGRREAGKAELECVVVEADWPEYESTWRAIEARVTGAQPAPSVPDGWIQRGMAELEVIRNRHDDDTPLNDRALIERIGKAMLAAAPETKEIQL